MPSSRSLDISVVVTAHHEGRLAHHTMRSVWNSVRQAQAHGIECEVVVVLDRPDDTTRDYFAQHQPDARVYEVDFGDTGPTRNYGAEMAAGRYVNFLDGDDLFCENWLRLAFAAAERTSFPCLFHPLYTVLFDTQHAIWRHQSTTDAQFCYEDTLEYCHWLPPSLTPRDYLLRHPIKECSRGSGFGSEDWHWYCEMLAQGVHVRTVDRTCLFWRRRPGTRSFEHISTEAVKRPSQLFDWPVLQDKVLEAQARRPLKTVRPPAPQPVAIAPPPPPAPPPAPPAPVMIAPPPPPPLSLKRRLIHAAVPAPVRRVSKAAVRMTIPWRIRHALRTFLLTGSATTQPMLPPPAPAPEPIQAAPPVEPPPAPLVEHAPARPSIPPWLIKEWKAAHAIEPLLFPEQNLISSVYLQYDDQRNASTLGKAYIDLCQRLPDPVSHVILVPWLRTGGSDLEAINYVRALVDGGQAEGIVVLSTEAIDSPWARRLPPYVAFLEFGKLYGHLDERLRRLLLLRFLLQKQPQVIHNMNSFLGYNTLIKNGKALSERSRLYTHVYCDMLTPEGKWHGYNRYYLPKCIDVLTGVLSDNQTELDRIADIFPFDREKMKTHYQPVTLRPFARSFEDLRKKEWVEVLWAGRMDRQKRPDLLARIAERCDGYPLRFHVYGAPVLEGDHSEVPQGSNIIYHGPYDGFQSLPTNNFDIYLYTSQYDGLPNVLLEAMAVGLPVVASDVGGVSELVVHGETGFLVNPFDDPDRYVESLLDIYMGWADVGRIVQNAYQLLERRHSWDAFIHTVHTTPGYTAAATPRIQEAA